MGINTTLGQNGMPGPHPWHTSAGPGAPAELNHLALIPGGRGIEPSTVVGSKTALLALNPWGQHPGDARTGRDSPPRGQSWQIQGPQLKTQHPQPPRRLPSRGGAKPQTQTQQATHLDHPPTHPKSQNHRACSMQWHHQHPPLRLPKPPATLFLSPMPPSLQRMDAPGPEGP